MTMRVSRWGRQWIIRGEEVRTRPECWNYNFLQWPGTIQSWRSWDTGIRMALLTRSSASIPQQGPLMLSVFFFLIEMLICSGLEQVLVYNVCLYLFHLFLNKWRKLYTYIYIYWRRKWQPTPVLLPGESHGGRSLVGYSPWHHKESDTTHVIHACVYVYTYVYL